MKLRGIRDSRGELRIPQSGFTLVEVLIGVTIAGLMLAGCWMTLNMWARSSVSLANYAEMSGGNRRALDLLAYDVRMANDVSVSEEENFTFLAYDSGSGNVTVSYDYDEDAQTLTRTYDGVSRIILEDVDDFEFTYFDLNRNETDNELSVKMVQIEAVLLKSFLSINNTDEIISAQFMLRNRLVSI